MPLPHRASSFNLSRLRDSIKPFRLHFFTRLGSTNDYASVLRKRKKLFAPAIVLTSHQIAGRGRGSNTWWSGAGSLTVTFVLPVQDHWQPHQIPLLAGLAVRNALAATSGIDDIQLKWPNDLVHRDKKLAGLLCERLDRIDLIGLGVNVNVDVRQVPTSLRDQVTSLSAIRGSSLDMTQTLIEVARSLHRAISRRDQPPFAELLKEYDLHHALIGRRIRVTGAPDEPALVGTCAGLDKMGRLLLNHKNVLARVIAGQVTLLDRAARHPI